MVMNDYVLFVVYFAELEDLIIVLIVLIFVAIFLAVILCIYYRFVNSFIPNFTLPVVTIIC